MMSNLHWTNTTVKLGELRPWAQNPKFSTKAQAKRILDSFKKFGQVQTVAVSPSLDVYDGHQRLSALLTIHGAEYKIDARQSNRPLTDKERQELVITLHTGAVGSYDWNMLSGWDAQELGEWGMNKDTLGGWKSDVTNLKELIESQKPETVDAEPQMDRAAELLEKWQVKTGDLWQIGEHRILCGDCTKREDVERVMGGEKADLVVTSPPYFNQREYSQWESYEDYLLFASKVINTFQVENDCIVCINIGSDEPAHHWIPSDWWCILRDNEYIYRECIAWVKAAAVWSVPRSMHIENCHYFPALRWEIMLVVSKGKHPVFELDDIYSVRKFDENVWNIGVVTGGEQKKLGHNAPYPVEIPERFIMVYTTKGKMVYDPFVGSGTTLVACQNLGRRGRAIEISPAYCSVTLERMANAFPELEIKRI